MHYKTVDRCFNMEFGYWEENYELWDIFKDNGIKNEAEANIFFNFDKINAIGGNIWMSPPFENKVIEETATTKIIMNGDGFLQKFQKTIMIQFHIFIKSSIITPEDWEKCKAESVSEEMIPNRMVDIEMLKKMASC